LYGAKKRVFAKFFNDMEAADGNRKITVAYGSASFSPGGKGEVNVPVGQAFNECKMRFPTLVVDEFRTTVVHHGTDTMLQKVQRRKDKETRTTVRGLLWCSSTSRKNKFVNRDLNAALNILRCAVGQRPEIMTRKSKTKVDKSVGKLVRS
jgi:RNA 3'-terminal phosphate cyclase